MEALHRETGFTILPSFFMMNLILLIIHTSGEVHWYLLVLLQVRLAGGITLIHCVAGVSRSAALCIAYLVKYEQLSLLEAYNHVKGLRQIVRPNAGFFGQLVEFERRVSGRQTVSMIYSKLARSCIPHLYEDEYRRKYHRLCNKV